MRILLGSILLGFAFDNSAVFLAAILILWKISERLDKIEKGKKS